MLDFIYYPVSAILWFWHKAFSPLFGADSGLSWALAVVFLVFTLRALLLRPFVAQIRAARAMQKFAPEIAELQKKYKKEPQKLAEEMRRLRTDHGVNPVAGCLPALVQAPVFIGLYHVLRVFQPGATRNYVFGAADIRSFVDADLFGARLSSWITMPAEQLATFGTTRGAVVAVAVPLMVVAAVATHLTARHAVARQRALAAVTPAPVPATPGAPNPATMANTLNGLSMWVFPAFVLVGGVTFPIAILLYWLSNNVWTLGQQWAVHRWLDQRDEAAPQAPPSGGTPGDSPGDTPRGAQG